ncbi:EAL domain-containing protein [Zobellella iuensis]|uniref:EAL domain-containing protein n=1 Tax=Zobellella iuensis TaxID=2803811 RepID=A0ABS1QLN1_9GAMM|nr:EAL domain-containing protein [Zobellella iuensis]MBL1375778.1 EAL domain-containing protein [Zobellella iuensis]
MSAGERKTGQVCMLALMTCCRKQHVSIALDDFGSGFASLLHLRDFPFDELKIDCGFAR